MEFIIVGGVAAVLSGAPVATFDLDVVHGSFCGERRAPHGRAQRDASDLSRPDGPAAAAIGAGRGYEMTESRSLGDFTVRVLSLAALIRSKEELGRDKDRATIAILKRTLDEKTRSS